jgi:hypothetical protein
MCLYVSFEVSVNQKTSLALSQHVSFHISYCGEA